MSDSPFAPPGVRPTDDETSPAPEPRPGDVELEPVIAWIELRPPDLVRPQLRWFFRRPWVWLMVALSSAWAIMQLKSPAGALAGLLPLVMLVAMAAVVVWGARQRFQQLRPPQKKLEFRFTQDHFEIGDQTSSSKVAWSSIHHFEEQKDAFLVFFSEGLFHVLPKRALHTSEEISLARQWLLAKVTRKPVGGRTFAKLVIWGVLVFLLFLIWQVMGGVAQRAL